MWNSLSPQKDGTYWNVREPHCTALLAVVQKTIIILFLLIDDTDDYKLLLLQ